LPLVSLGVVGAGIIVTILSLGIINLNSIIWFH
jgi:hypothetical protein